MAKPRGRKASTRRAPRSGELARRLGGCLRELRGEQTLTEFANRLGISKSSLSRIERGEQNVSMATLELICEQLGLDIGELFGGELPPKS